MFTGVFLVVGFFHGFYAIRIGVEDIYAISYE